MRLMQARRFFIAAIVVAVGAFAAAVDASAPVSIAQETQPPGDDFSERAFWYSDDFAGIDAFPRTERFSNAGATLEPGETAPCGPIGSTVWFSWPADRDGTLHIDAAGLSNNVTIVAIYEFDWGNTLIPSPPGAALRNVACDVGGPSGGDAADVSLAVRRNTEYLIQVGGVDGAQGDIELHASCECAPANDTWQYPRYINVDPYMPEARSAVDTSRATTEPTEDVSCGNMGATVWFVTYAPNSPRLDFDVTDSNFAAAVAVYQIDYNTPANTPWGALPRRIACSTGGTLTLDLDESAEYVVQVGGIDGARGNAVLEMRCNPHCPPYNDNHGAAEWIEPPASYYVRTDGATVEPDEPQPCGGMGSTVWYFLVTRGDTRITITTNDATKFPAAIAVHELTGISPPGGFDLVTCDAAQSATDTATVSFDAEANAGYHLQIGGVGGASGELEFDVSCDPAPCPPFTDSVHYPMQFGIPGSTQPEPIVIGLDARGGTVEPGEPTACGNMGRTTWYAVDWYEGQTATGVRVSTDGSDFDTAIAIYQTPIGVWQPEFSQLTPVTCAVSGPQRAAAAFSVVPNTRTWVQVGGRDGAGGYLNLSVACDPYCPPGNDHSGSAWEIFAGQTYDIDTRGATLEVGEPAACGAVEHTVWFRTTQNAPFEMTVNTADSNFDTLIAVYPVTAFSPPGGTTQSIACGTNSVSFSGAEGVSYLVQIGSPASDPNGGALVATMTCEGDGCNYGGGQGGGGLPVPDTGGSGGVVTGPETGSGGYLSFRE